MEDFKFDTCFSTPPNGPVRLGPFATRDSIRSSWQSHEELPSEEVKVLELIQTQAMAAHGAHRVRVWGKV